MIRKYCTSKLKLNPAEESKTEQSETSSHAGDTTSISTTNHTTNHDEDEDPNDLLVLKILRLNFLDIGPGLQNLDFCEAAEDIYLSNNRIERIGNGFARNYNLSILKMPENFLTDIDAISF